MDLSQFNLDKLVALANKISPSMNYVNGPVLITTIGTHLDYATALSKALDSRVDRRYFSECLDYQMANELRLIRGRTRAMVIMMDKIALGSESVNSFKYSLMTVATACCSYVGEPDFRPIAGDFIVDMDAELYFKRKTTRSLW